MPRASRHLASAAVILLFASTRVFCDTSADAAGAPGPSASVGRVASFAAGSISGIVLDESGQPVAGALVSSLGGTTASAVTDRYGRFEIRTLPPGPYVVRAHLSGYVAARAVVIQVRPNARASSSISLKRATESPRVLAAGVGLPSGEPVAAPDAAEPVEGDADASDTDHDHSEAAWRLRHARRGVLKDATIPDEFLARATPAGGRLSPGDFLGRAAESSARMATSFFQTTPFSGQVNLLAAGSFDAGEDLLSTNTLLGNLANVTVSAPVGTQGDWTVHGGFTQADIASWIVAGSYKTRGPAVHSYDLGLSYAAQRYSGTTAPVALEEATGGGRSSGEVYGFDTLAVSPTLSVTYGARYAHYDYLDKRNLMRPRVEVALTPGASLRFNVMASRRAVAPGAEEFSSPADSGIWLPPQRTVSSIDPGAPLYAERVSHVALEAERDFGRSTVSLEAFSQRIGDQMVTLFGVDLLGQPVASGGHYLVGNAGDGHVDGYKAAYRAAVSEWVKGSVEYTIAHGDVMPGDRSRYVVLLTPSAVRAVPERLQSVAASIEASVPETSTRLVIFYRVGNGYAAPSGGGQPGPDGSRFDSRFDVQLHQSLPFMDFANARWEMLVAIRNFSHEAAVDQSVYDDLLVIRPPKRIVGGLTMRF